MEFDAPLSGGLTEEAVKQRFVPFLKDFYRHRYEPVPNTIEVSFNNVSAEGFIADGLMRFMRPDGKAFVCTYESTSKEKVDEVKFSLNINYFLWDCAAFGAAFTAVSYLLSYVSAPIWLMLLGWTGNLGLLLGLGMIGFLSWYFTMSKWRKYRYIFAVEQFKQYQADEQWIALAADVFLSPTDPYLTELKNQCVYNGFGLAIVPEFGAVRVLNAPTRLRVYGKDRKMVEWITDRDWFQRASHNFDTLTNYRPPDQMTALWNQVTRPVRYLVTDPLKKYVWGAMSKPLGQTTSVYNRFMDAHLIQKWIFFVCLILISPFLKWTLERRNENVEDLNIQRRADNENPEDLPNDLYLSETQPIPYDGEPTGVPKQYPLKSQKQPERTAGAAQDGIESDESVPTIQLSGDDEEPEPAAPPPAKRAAPPKKAAPAKARSSGDPCAFLRKSAGWIVQDNVFSKIDNAQNRVQVLLGLQFSCQMVPRHCLEAGKSGYLIWVGPVYTSEAAAKKGAAAFEKTLRSKKIATGKWVVRKI